MRGFFRWKGGEQVRKIGIGIQDFETIRKEKVFYIDKTGFVKEWWESVDIVTLIARPRRFGKTLTMDMLDKFFSVNYAGRSDLFEGLEIWEDKKYRELQGTCPVIFLSFANVKEETYEGARSKINRILTDLYIKKDFLKESGVLKEQDMEFFQLVNQDMDETTATMAIHKLCEYLQRYYGRKVIILLDEYDTPMQEAYVNGYWEEIVSFMRGMFNAAFKTNPYLERGIMTGITRVSKESIFSDLNNLKVVTTTSDEYADKFGFTEKEVFGALEEFGLADRKQEVRAWYDGFTFGNVKDIYNPWSVINYLDTGKFAAYWANTSSNSLIGTLLRHGSREIKQDFERLMQGETLEKEIDEQIVYNQLDDSEDALWSLLLASGYLKVRSLRCGVNEVGDWEEKYRLELTNFEVKTMFRKMIKTWFGKASSQYNNFIRALFADDVEEMTAYMNKVAMETFSYFDTGGEPERFYHGFVLGLLVELNSRYVMRSNHESGFGRYDVMLEPRKPGDNAYILEFKVMNARKEKSLSETAQTALKQIEDKKYETTLISRGIPKEKIRKYGFAFCGKEVLIESA